jgi:type II secretory pathway pseudopilin PulG
MTNQPIIKLRYSPRAAFTLVEIVVALGLVSLIAMTSLWTLSDVNRQAAAHRLFTEAQAIAQNQIELFQTDGPFNPQLNQIPLSLQLDKRWKQGVTIYTDPHNDSIVVTGNLTTTVLDPAISIGGVSLNLRQVTVRLDYIFGGHTYVVRMNSMRASDL